MQAKLQVTATDGEQCTAFTLVEAVKFLNDRGGKIEAVTKGDIETGEASLTVPSNVTIIGGSVVVRGGHTLTLNELPAFDWTQALDESAAFPNAITLHGLDYIP